ncbi:DMT family transporter [Chelatococcus sp. SYSU_G07232]|uniref:DMT family transporter n=1 Tax=Chelatococcus albus TaxID=3047466 RepID=A0ABT7AEW2_9HYPH|nr:DMT family transporter [Chelatococcus sp. SYSU_G07232]MDJ1157905.1 DMT family transporter [Chelatococcus sp. SYSU_G07232]
MMRNAFLRAAVGIALLSAMDAVIKAVAARYPTFEVTFLRFASGTLVALAVVAVRRPGWPSRETVAVNASRALLVVFTASCFFYALGRLPLAEALALSFLSPIFLALFGMIILRERVGGRIVVALAAGFIGMLVIVSGLGEAGGVTRIPWDGAAAALASALSYALSMVLLRARAARDRVEIIILFQNVGPALVIAPLAAGAWVVPAVPDYTLFALIGLLGTTGHLILATAFARAEAARLAPLEYTAMVWAVLLGFVFFGEWPGVTTLAGAALIIAGAFAVVRR